MNAVIIVNNNNNNSSIKNYWPREEEIYSTKLKTDVNSAVKCNDCNKYSHSMKLIVSIIDKFECIQAKM